MVFGKDREYSIGRLVTSVAPASLPMNLLRAASTISLFTLASRITGLVRDIVISSVFGAGASFDAFNVAFRIPNLLRRLFGEGAFSQAFVPILAATKAAKGEETTRDLVSAETVEAARNRLTAASVAPVWGLSAGRQGRKPPQRL